MYEITVSGMTCNGCVKSISNALKILDPSAKVEINLQLQKINIQSSKKIEEIVLKIENAGYLVVQQKEVGSP